jgi:hypothetical protein
VLSFLVPGWLVTPPEPHPSSPDTGPVPPAAQALTHLSVGPVPRQVRVPSPPFFGYRDTFPISSTTALEYC